MLFEEAMKEMKIEIEEFENDLKALEKTDIDAEYRIQIINELIEYILARQTILNHVTKQEKMIDLIKTRIFVSSEEHEEILKIQGKHRNKSYEDCIIEYFEKKAEEVN